MSAYFRLNFDNIEYNYQENPHQWSRTKKFSLNFWGVLIALAIMVGQGMLPWWIMFIPFIQACDLFIGTSATITSSSPMPYDDVKALIKDIERNGI
jgi:hypothetical protein